MPTCVFKTDDLRRPVTHTLQSTEWDMAWESGPNRPGLLFVHDNGVYLMSNGVPRDRSEDNSETCHVAYAEHCNPQTDPEFYENSRELVGGDDFVEVINVDESFLQQCAEYDEFHIVVTQEQLECLFANPKPLAANAQN
jgi:hypothetical protein